VAWSLRRFACGSLLSRLCSSRRWGVGLYCQPCARGRRPPRLRDSFVLAKRVIGQAGVFALAQVVILLLWSRAGMLVSALVTIQPGELRSLFEFLLIGSAIVVRQERLAGILSVTDVCRVLAEILRHRFPGGHDAA
jgi:hypothetical protein